MLAYTSARKGEQLTLAGKDFTAQVLPNGVVRLIGAGLNQNTIGNGNVAFLTFYVISGLATGGTPLTLKNCAASDAQGQNVAITCTGGAITTRKPGSCSCDLNGDGSVNVMDVQALINQVLGATPPTACGDINRDGVVNVLDVQILIEVVLGVRGCN